MGVLNAEDQASRVERLEIELRHAQKLEAVGSLAAGVAHEINTPIQYAGDSVNFVGEVFDELLAVLQAYEALETSVRASGQFPEACATIAEARRAADMDFVVEEVPAALERARVGIDRVSSIVSAMRAFAHPGSSTKARYDLREALQATLEVSRNEYKYVADLEVDLQPIPEVLCKLGDLNQVFLNLVVNAAHAIADALDGVGRGTIGVSTRYDEGFVEVSITDTGTGIPQEIRDRIFDPFFTTKEVGVGTGQGLAIARRLIVDGHGGTLHFEDREQGGTRFVIRLPAGAEGETAT